MFILHEADSQLCILFLVYGTVQCIESFFSQPFIFNLLSILIPHLNLNLELIPGVKVISGWELQQKSPLSLLVIGQHADDSPLGENYCISNA